MSMHASIVICIELSWCDVGILIGVLLLSLYQRRTRVSTTYESSNDDRSKTIAWSIPPPGKSVNSNYEYMSIRDENA
jgi:hypothetical protein